MKRICIKLMFGFLLLALGLPLLAQEIVWAGEDGAAEAPVVAFFPFAYSTAIGKDLADSMRAAIGKTMTERQTFAPFALTEWLDQEYQMEKAVNMDAILAKARKAEYPADFLCEGTFFKSGGYYAVVCTLYPLDEENYVSYYYRFFQNIESMGAIAGEIVTEMENRAVRTQVEELLFDKMIYVERITPRFLFKPNVQTGDTQLAETPALNIDGVDYNSTTDQFFNALLAYNFHISRLFKTRSMNTNKYLINTPQYPEGVDYSVSVDLVATDSLTLLQFVVWDEENAEIVCYYQYPLGRLELTALDAAFRKNALTIFSRILGEKQLKEVGIVNFKVANRESPVYFKDYFIGKGSQQNTLLPFGLNEIRVGGDSYLKFVEPFILSKYTGEETVQSAELLRLLE